MYHIFKHDYFHPETLSYMNFHMEIITTTY